MADHGIGCIATRLDRSKEQSLFIFKRMLQTEISCDSVFVVEVLRRLDHCHLRIPEESDRSFEKIAAGDKVRVKAQNQIAGTAWQRMV